MEPLKPFEKWLYPSMVLWLAAVLWLSLVVWPSRPFVSEFDSYVAWTLKDWLPNPAYQGESDGSVETPH